MPYDLHLATLLRSDMAEYPGLSEKPMFGGLALLLDGHLVCGVNRRGGLFHVGARAQDAALARPGARQMRVSCRSMPGLVELDRTLMTDGGIRRDLLQLALDFVRSLPAK